MRTAKSLIRLGGCPNDVCVQERQISLPISSLIRVFTGCLMCMSSHGPMLLHTNREDSDQTRRMRRLSLVLAGHIYHFVVLAGF